MNKGYFTYHNRIPMFILDNISRDFDKVASESNKDDVFRTANGDVKQIQNLQNRPEFKALSNILLEDFDGEILNMQYFIKHPTYKITAPHQDGAYFNDTDSDIYTCWIPLHDVTIENSCMHYIDWDGKREILPHDAIGKNIRTRTGKTGYSQYTSVYDLDEFKPVEVSYGDFIVHNQFAVHYSSINKTETPRIAVTCIIKLKK